MPEGHVVLYSPPRIMPVVATMLVAVTFPCEYMPLEPTVRPEPTERSFAIFAFSQTSRDPVARSPMVAAGASMPEMSMTVRLFEVVETT